MLGRPPSPTFGDDHRLGRRLFVLWILGTAVRLGFSLLVPFPYIFNDELEYWLYGHELQHGQAFMTWWQGQLNHYPAYVYPFWISLVTRLAHSSVAQFWVLRTADALAIASVVFAAGWFARRLGLDARKAFFAAVLTLALGGVDFGTQTMAESLFFPLFIWSVFALWAAARSGRLLHVGLAGLAVWLALFTKPQGAVLIAAFLVLLPLTARRHGAGRAALALLTFAVTGLPFLLIRAHIAALEGYADPWTFAAIAGYYASQVPVAHAVRTAAFLHTVDLYGVLFVIIGGGVPLVVALRGREALQALPDAAFWLLTLTTTLLLWLTFAHNGAQHGMRLEERYLFEPMGLWCTAFLTLPRPRARTQVATGVAVAAAVAVFAVLAVPSLNGLVPFDAPSLTAMYTVFRQVGVQALDGFAVIVAAAAMLGAVRGSRIGLVLLLACMSLSYYVALPTLPVAQDHRTAMRLVPFVARTVPKGDTVVWADHSIPLGVMRNLEFFGLFPWTGSSAVPPNTRTCNEWYLTNRPLADGISYRGYTLVPPPRCP